MACSLERQRILPVQAHIRAAQYKARPRDGQLRDAAGAQQPWQCWAALQAAVAVTVATVASLQLRGQGVLSVGCGGGGGSGVCVSRMGVLLVPAPAQARARASFLVPAQNTGGVGVACGMGTLEREHGCFGHVLCWAQPSSEARASLPDSAIPGCQCFMTVFHARTADFGSAKGLSSLVWVRGRGTLRRPCPDADQPKPLSMSMWCMTAGAGEDTKWWGV